MYVMVSLNRGHSSSSDAFFNQKMFIFFIFMYENLTPVLLNSDIPCLCKQYRSRSVGF